METSHREAFFQTDASNAEAARKVAKAGNKHGDPLAMKSKILAVTPDPFSPSTSIFIAESAGYVRRITLSSAEPKTTYRGPKAPVTCVAVGGPGNKTVFGGSWDKDIWSWDVDSAQPGRKLSGHTDFVKVIITTKLSGKDILISGSADKKIFVWDIETGRRIHTLQDPTTTMMAVQDIAMDPVLSTEHAIVITSASSDPHIRRWKITATGFEQLVESFHDRPDTERLTIAEHDTSVYRLVYDVDGEDCDLWTASADGTAKCLVRSRNFVAEDTFTHGDYVRAVIPTDTWVVTAGRDENIKIWDKLTGKLYCTLEGHYEEITGLVMLRNSRGLPERICSVSIDGTIRTWPLAKSELDVVVKMIEDSKKPVAEEERAEVGQLLTAEEEAELAELMEDD